MKETPDQERKKTQLISKIEELNKRIEQLKQQKQKVQVQQAIRSLTTVEKQGAKTRHYSLDFINSNNLSEIEEGIKETIRGVVLAKTAVYKSLANIDKKRLYKQAGVSNFMEYLASERIPIKYKTAKEYAKIGDVLIRYEKPLQAIQFSEEDGLKKLIYLERALKREDIDKQQVFAKVKEYSLRAFKEFAVPSEDSKEGDSAEEGQPEPLSFPRHPDSICTYEDNNLVVITEHGEKRHILTISKNVLQLLNPEQRSAFLNELSRVTDRFIVSISP